MPLLEVPDKIAASGRNQVAKDLLASAVKKVDNAIYQINRYPPFEQFGLVFNHNAWPTVQSELLDFGQEAIMHLSTWFQPVLRDIGCIIAAIPSQWTSLKVLVSTQFKGKGTWICGPPFTLKYLTEMTSKMFCILVDFLLVLRTSAAQCERAISAQNKIKKRFTFQTEKENFTAGPHSGFQLQQLVNPFTPKSAIWHSRTNAVLTNQNYCKK